MATLDCTPVSVNLTRGVSFVTATLTPSAGAELLSDDTRRESRIRLYVYLGAEVVFCNRGMEKTAWKRNRKYNRQPLFGLRR